MNVKALQQDAILLANTYTVLQALMNRRNVQKAAQYYEAFELVSAMRIIKREQEKVLYLLAMAQRRQPPAPSPDPEYPPVPAEVQVNPSTILQSDFVQTVFKPTQR